MYTRLKLLTKKDKFKNQNFLAYFSKHEAIRSSFGRMKKLKNVENQETKNCFFFFK